MSTENSTSHVQRILEVHQRRESHTARDSVRIRVLGLRHANDAIDPKQTELLRYFPVALVSCVETFFKLTIKELVDHGNPYLRNAQELMEKRYYDYEVLTSLHGQVITIGDLISHHVRVSNLNNLLGVLSKVMGLKFRDEVETAIDRFSVEVMEREPIPIISNINTTFVHVSEVFRLRHIICHEAVADISLTKAQVSESINQISTFLRASSCLIDNTLYPDAPLAPWEIDTASADNYAREKEKLEDLIEETQKFLSERQIEKFAIANAAWKKFLEASAELEGLEFEDGSIQSTAENLVRASLTRERQMQIRNLTKHIGDTDEVLKKKGGLKLV